MNKPLIRCLFVAASMVVTAKADEKPNLWILSGQSNACGRAKLPGPKADSRVTHFDPSVGKFVVAQDPLPGMGTTGVGPWVAAAQEVARGGIEVRTLGFASGGKPIQFWDPGKPGDKGLFPRIKKVGQGARVFLWYQGESNSGKPEEVATYKSDLKKLVQRVRKQAANPQMTVVVIQLGAFTREGRDFMGMREMQRQFVIEDGNALLVPALGRPLKDTVHLNNKGYQELGREIGRALLKTKYNTTDVNWPGPVLDAAVASDKVKTVIAHFAEVEQLSGCFAYDFAVIDTKGINPCVAANSVKTLVELTLKRPVVMPAKLVYGYGENPKALLIDEAGNHAPAVQIAVTAGALPKDVSTTAPNGAARVKDRASSP